MKRKLSFIAKEISEAKKKSLYRRLQHASLQGSRITIRARSLLNLCSNDYLGMPASAAGTRQMQSSSRLVSGNDDSYHTLEKRLARHKSYQGSLVYPTGYMANLGLISTIIRKGDLILSDELNHASIIQACRLAGAETAVYKHNDMDDLAAKLKSRARNKFIITEGVFSMDGDSARLQEIAELAQKSDSITIVDDAHGDFVAGHDGKGTPNSQRVSKKIDVYVSSLSKGLGSFGGYVASDGMVIDLCINKSKPFIYTSALPSYLVEHSLKRLDMDRERYRRRLLRNVERFSAGLRAAGYDVKKSHIIPIIIGDEKTTLDAGRFLYKNGIFVQPIRYPTVPKNKARLRVSITAWLAKKELDHAVDVFEKTAKKFRL